MWIRLALLSVVTCLLHFKSVAKMSDTASVKAQIDSAKAKSNTTFLGSLSTSFLENINWQATDMKNYALLASVDYSHKKEAERFKKLYQLRGELGFLKFIDSTWYKNADQLNVSAQWTTYSAKVLTHSYSIILKTQFADSWKYTTGMNGEAKREWIGGMLNPAALTLGYGLNYDFWKQCFINVAFATFKINAHPINDDELKPWEKELLRTKKSMVIGEYGLSVQSAIAKKIYEHILWDSKTQFFTKGSNKNQVTLDFQNRLTFSFPKFLQFKADTHIVYDPLYSYRLQYKHEFVVGIFLEKKKQKN
jgi:hypothetical protein